MHLGPEAVRRQQQQAAEKQYRLWQAMRIFKRGYAGLRVVSTQAWRQRFDALHWGNGYMGQMPDIRCQMLEVRLGGEG